MSSCATDAPHPGRRAALLGGLATTNHGGRPCIAHGPNQGIFCSRVRRHSKTLGGTAYCPSAFECFQRTSLEAPKAGGPFGRSSLGAKAELLQFDLGAGVFQLLLGG